MEQEIGLTLFERSKFGMRPTPQGELFAAEVQRSYSGLARVKAAAIRQGLVGELVVAALPVLSDGFAARALGGLAVAQFPGVRAIPFQAARSWEVVALRGALPGDLSGQSSQLAVSPVTSPLMRSR